MNKGKRKYVAYHDQAKPSLTFPNYIGKCMLSQIICSVFSSRQKRERERETGDLNSNILTPTSKLCQRDATFNAVQKV